jgi:hypothetical protein
MPLPAVLSNIVARRSKKVLESVSGTFSAMPHSVMDSYAFQGAGHPARSLLYELIRQLSGRNNGHLQLASPWLKRRGWNSADVVQRAKAELLIRQLAIKTRLGGLNAGPDLWAVTWLPISNYTGLTEVSALTYHPGRVALSEPSNSRSETRWAFRLPEQCCSVSRNGGRAHCSVSRSENSAFQRSSCSVSRKQCNYQYPVRNELLLIFLL